MTVLPDCSLALDVELLLSSCESMVLLGRARVTRLATWSVIIFGYCPCLWTIVLRNVSIAFELDWPSNEMPFTFSNWSFSLSRPSRDAAPPANILFTNIPRSPSLLVLPPLPFDEFCEPVFPFTLTPRPAFSVSLTGMCSVRISRFRHGNVWALSCINPKKEKKIKNRLVSNDLGRDLHLMMRIRIRLRWSAAHYWFVHWSMEGSLFVPWTNASSSSCTVFVAKSALAVLVALFCLVSHDGPRDVSAERSSE